MTSSEEKKFLVMNAIGFLFLSFTNKVVIVHNIIVTTSKDLILLLMTIR